MVSDTIIRELAWDFAKQAMVIHDMKKAEIQCDTILDRQARLIGDWQDKVAQRDEQIALLKKKRRRAKNWRWVERVGLLGVGIFITTRL